MEDPEEFWLKRSVVDFTLLFTDNEEHEKYATEQDLLDDVYSFIKNSKKINGTKAAKYVHVWCLSLNKFWHDLIETPQVLLLRSIKRTQDQSAPKKK